MKGEIAMKEQEKMEMESFDEMLEGFQSHNCGSSDAKYECKKDCIFAHNAVISAIY